MSERREFKVELAILVIAAFVIGLAILGSIRIGWVQVSDLTGSNLALALLTAFLASIGGIGVVLIQMVLSGKKIERTQEPIKVEIVRKPVVLELNPLPHRRGLPRALTLDELKQMRDEAMKTAEKFPMRNVARKGSVPTEFTHPDGRFLEPCQWMSKYDVDPSNLRVRATLRAKFGVIRVRPMSGTVKACKARVRYRILEEEGKSKNENWIEDGYLNWYSPELNAKIFVAQIDKSSWTYGINRYLVKSEETVPEGETRDLLAFYMIEDVANVHLCSSMEAAPLGWAEKSPLKFEIELTVTGDDYPSTIWRFQGSAIWDDFSLIPIQEATKPEATPKPEPTLEKPSSTPSNEIRPTPTSQQSFILSLAQESKDIKMREIRVQAPSGQIFKKDANFYTVAIAVPSNSENAVDFKIFFRKPNTGDAIHLYELYKIPTTGLPYMFVPWNSPNPFRPDVTFHFAGAVRMTVIKQAFTLAATTGPRLGFAPFVFLYTIRDNNRVFVPTNSAWDVEMPAKFQTEVWAEANNKAKTRLARLEVDARTWDNISVTELQT